MSFQIFHGGYLDGSHHVLLAVGTQFADSTVEAAVTKLMYLQGRYPDNRMVREKLKQSLAGEITLPE